MDTVPFQLFMEVCYDRRTENTDCKFKGRRLWVCTDCPGSRHIGEYCEIILQEKETCRENGGFPGHASRSQGWESFLPLLWERGGADSWEEGEKVLLGQMPEQMVEQSP